MHKGKGTFCCIKYLKWLSVQWPVRKHCK